MQWTNPASSTVWLKHRDALPPEVLRSEKVSVGYLSSMASSEMTTLGTAML